MVNPHITYEGPAYVNGLADTNMPTRPGSVERVPNGLWRVDHGSGLARTYDRDPRLALGPGPEPRRPRRSLNEAAHKLAR